MPYVTISITPGFSAAQKKQLMQRTSDAVVQSIGAPVASIRILLHELQEGCYLNAGQFDTQGLMFLVEFIAGRTVEQKAALIAALSRAGSETTGIPESEVRARLIDFPKHDMGMAGGVSAAAQGR
ncbi:tautomerase family protein [Pollutimonas sp. M17]|jgi:4-oxalocrotonate tautomerase family enzyme|uniref:tautomerase family protein n=1 Tax=Pollutimonas sp. M17 TaxID=2962065 RepID=UPI0021F49467|nr:tautomerase family protein [Pollutimonas sp. M17]UYO94912.1 tautomerase family protein [Pollutimonas sp. M17]